MTKLKFEKFDSVENMLRSIEKLPYHNKEKVNFFSNSKDNNKTRYKSAGFNIYYSSKYQFYTGSLSTGETYSSISEGFIELVKPKNSSSFENNNETKHKGFAMTYSIVEKSFRGGIIITGRGLEEPSDDIYLSTYFKFYPYDDRERLLNHTLELFFNAETMYKLQYYVDFVPSDEKVRDLIIEEFISSELTKVNFPEFTYVWENDPDFVKKFSDGIKCIDEIATIEYHKSKLFQKNKNIK